MFSVVPGVVGDMTVEVEAKSLRMVDHRQRWNPAGTKLANFHDNEGHVVGEGTVPPGSYAVEDRLLHIDQW